MNELSELLTIKEKIHTIRGVQVMLDSDLAAIYGYTTSRFNEQVSNNNERFQGEEFSFILTKEEVINLMSKKSISSWGGRRTLPRVFTESGVYMLIQNCTYCFKKPCFDNPIAFSFIRVAFYMALVAFCFSLNSAP